MNEGIKMNHEQVMEALPHRAPMLLVDEVLSLVPGKEVTARFHIREDMAIFQGHFPGNPVLPGVYSVESMAQTADVLVLSIEKYRGKTPLFLGIQKASFKRMVKPGDTLTLHVTMVSEREDKAIITCKGEAFNGDALCAECEIALALR